MAINEGYLLAQDSYRGAAGKAFTVINGSNELLFGLKKFNSSAEIQTGEFKVVGALTEQEKVKGLKYSGSATIYYGTPTFLTLLSEFKRTGKFPTINFQITNDDPSSSLGTQTVVLYNVILKKIPIAVLDDSAESLQIDIEFTFSDFEVLKSLLEPGGIDHSESSRNNQSELIRNSQCTSLAN